MSEVPLSPRAAYSARPTVRVGGEADERVSELLIELELNEWAGGLSALEARFSNVASTDGGEAELAFEDDRRLKLGAEIAIYAGEDASPTEIFRGTITGLEGEWARETPPELVVLAEDPFQRARMRRITKLHEDVSLADLATSLANQLNLTPRIDGLNESIGTRLQLNESDLAFVRRLLLDYDADLQVVGTELHVAPRSQVRRGTVALELFGQLDRVRVLVDLAHQATEITSSGWDDVAGQPVAASSRGANLGPGSGTTGAQALERTLGTRSEHLGHMAVTRRTEAQALADAHFDLRARRFVTIEGTVEGNPAVRVGSHVNLTGISPRFDNTYYVVRARHRFDQKGGYRTEFEAECAYYGGDA